MGEEFTGKSDGSYAQTRGGYSYPVTALNSSVGLSLDQFRNENNMPIIAQNGIANNQEAVIQSMKNGQTSKTMIRSLETVSGAKRQSNYFKTSALEDDVRFGWAPDIQIIDDGELKKLEK